MSVRFVAVVVVAFTSSIASAQFAPRPNQWDILRLVDDFTDEESVSGAIYGADLNLMLMVTCLDGMPSVALVMTAQGDIFQDGNVATRWDGGDAENHAFVDRDDSLTLLNATDFVGRLLNHQELRVRVYKWRDEQIVDSFDVSNTADALSEMPCL